MRRSGNGTSLRAHESVLAWAIAILMLVGILYRPQIAFAGTAADEAKKPVKPPKPYRLPDGHLNWSGFWVPVEGMLQNNIGLGGSEPGTPSPLGKGGMPFSRTSKVKSPYGEQLSQHMKDMMAGKIVDPLALCLPPGMPGIMVMIYGMDFLQTPDQYVMISEWDDVSRHIWMNQKTHTPPDEINPTYNGESIGHWKGDTLIVDTVGIRDDVLLNNFGLKHSDKLHIVEELTETSPGILEDKFTFEDPEVFETPWSQVMTYRYRPDLRIEEYVCLENNRNVGENGKASF